ncbi:MAG: hypothetical protein HY295_00155 [Thaumarchaeota archaeon]|nr:hypothetical protein [Nitrososphaerota archaeon]
MKTIFLLIITSILTLEIVSSNNALGQYGGPVEGPSVYIAEIAASGNNVYVTWNGMDQNTKSPTAFLKTSNDLGMNFGKTINLAKYGITPYDSSIPSMKMTSSGNNLYLAWTDWKNSAVNSDIFFMKSNDGGSTFNEPLKIKGGEGISGVSALASSGNNVFVLLYNNTNSAYSDLLFAESNDGGTTFRKPLSLSTNHKFMIGNVQMAVSGNDIYIVTDGGYWGSQNGAIVFLASHNGGASFEHTTIVDNVMAFTPQLGVSGDNVYLVWMQMNGKNTNLFLEKSQDGGKSFGDKIKLNQEGEPRWPQLVVSGNDLYVKWVQSFPSGGSKLLFSKSTDGGNTFSKPFNLEGFTTGGFDFSQIGILKNENLFAVWTGEYDPSYSHSGVFFRKSVDGGSTFGAIYDLNAENKTRILNPKVTSSEKSIYVVGDTGAPGTSDVIFRSSTDSGETFSESSNLNSDKPVKTGVHEPLLLVPEFRPDIPQSEPPNSQFSNSQPASFVLGQPDFTSNSPSPTASTFFTPHFVTFDSQGNLWVSDGGNDRVLEFKPPFTMGESASVVLGQTDFTSWQVLNGTNPKSLYHPQGLAFDLQGNLWVADGASNRALKFKPPFRTGQEPSLVLGQKDFISWEQPQSTANSFYYPEGIAFDKEGNLWVADTNNRLLEFKPPFSNGQEASLILGNTDTVTSQGVSAHTISAPMGITFDSQGNLWVADSGNNRMLEFAYPFTSGQRASLILGQASFNAGAIDTKRTKSISDSWAGKFQCRSYRYNGTYKRLTRSATWHSL